MLSLYIIYYNYCFFFLLKIFVKITISVFIKLKIKYFFYTINMSKTPHCNTYEKLQA